MASHDGKIALTGSGVNKNPMRWHGGFARAVIAGVGLDFPHVEGGNGKAGLAGVETVSGDLLAHLGHC